MILNWLSSGGRGKLRQPVGGLKAAINFVLVALTVYNYYTLLVGSVPPFVQAASFGCGTLGLVMLTHTGGSKNKPLNILDAALAVICFSAAVYIVWNIEVWEDRWPSVTPLNVYELIAGAVLIIVSFEACRRTAGVLVAGIGALAVLYTALGHLLTGQFTHRPFSMAEIIDQFVFTTNGIFSPAMIVIAKYVFVLVSFGVFLDKSKGGELFSNICFAITKGMVGGPAKAAIFASAAYASISGSGAADAATTGAFTIPTMKRSGYPPRVAGGIEAAASTAGPFCPPVMGAVAFLMAELTSTNYRDVAIAAAPAAFLYFLALFIQIDIYSRKRRIGAALLKEIQSVKSTLKSRGIFLAPILILVYMILAGYSPGFAGIIGIVSLVLASWVRSDTRLGIKEILECIIESATRMIPIGAICASAGLIYGGAMVTGIGGKFGNLITAATNGSFTGTLILSGLIGLLLGMGLPILGVYIIGVILLIPALTLVGVPLLSAHLFLVYYSVLGSVTPPVCLISYTVAPIAKVDPIEMSWQAIRFAASGFIIPFVFVLKPEILLQGSFVKIVFSLVTVMVGIAAFAALIEQYVSYREKFNFLVLIAAMIILLFVRDVRVIAFGLILAGYVAITRWRGYRLKAEKRLTA